LQLEKLIGVASIQGEFDSRHIIHHRSNLRAGDFDEGAAAVGRNHL